MFLYCFIFIFPPDVDIHRLHYNLKWMTVSLIKYKIVWDQQISTLIPRLRSLVWLFLLLLLPGRSRSWPAAVTPRLSVPQVSGVSVPGQSVYISRRPVSLPVSRTSVSHVPQVSVSQISVPVCISVWRPLTAGRLPSLCAQSDWWSGGN